MPLGRLEPWLSVCGSGGLQAPAHMATLGDVHAEVPAETGKNLVACMVCRLLKTFDQARLLHSVCLAAETVHWQRRGM